MTRSAATDLGALFSVIALGCTQVVDDYRVGPSEPPAIENPCAEDEVLTDEHACVPVGVQPEMCTGGLAEREGGGCTAELPSTDCESGIARLGARVCSPSAALPCDEAGYADSVSYDNPIFVDATAGDDAAPGTKAQPLKTIRRALAATTGPVEVLVKGRFEENVVIDRLSVQLIGCGTWEHAEIAGVESVNEGPDHPCAYPGLENFSLRAATVCIKAGADDVTISGVDITGPGDGISVTGASGVVVRATEIHDTGYMGLRIFEAKTASDPAVIVRSQVTLEQVAVNRARGAGVMVVGSELVVRESSIQHTLELNGLDDVTLADPTLEELEQLAAELAVVPEDLRMGWARGVSIHPGWWSTSSSAPDSDSFAGSTAKITASVITGNEETNVFAEGATVEMDTVYLGALTEGAPSGRGITAQRSLPVGKPTTVTVTRSVIERASDAAIDVRDAEVTADRTTIADTFGRVGDGCTGQGIRARSFPTGDARAKVDTVDTSIIGSKQAGLFAAATSVAMTRTLVRGVTPTRSEGACANAFGDGIVLETYAMQEPSDARLEQVRVDGAARAAVATTGADLDMQSVLISCSTHGVVDTTGRSAPAVRGAVCGCSENWAECPEASQVLESWVLAGPSPVWPDAMPVGLACVGDGLNVDTPVDAWVTWNAFRPEEVPTSSADGCAWGRWASGDAQQSTIWALGYTAGRFAPGASGWNLGAPWPLTLAQGFGFPVMPSLFSLAGVPQGSRVVGDGIVLNGGTVVPDGRIPVSPDPNGVATPGAPAAVVFLAAREPGWKAIEITEIPEGVVCAQTGALGMSVREGLRVVRSEWGYWSQASFRQCTLSAP